MNVLELVAQKITIFVMDVRKNMIARARHATTHKGIFVKMVIDGIDLQVVPNGIHIA